MKIDLSEIKIRVNYFLITIACICGGLYLPVAIDLGQYRRLWMDDIMQIDMVWRDTLPEMLRAVIALDNNPPLSHLITFFWIKIVPYGTFWLLIPSILFVTLGIFFVGFSAYRLHGKLAGYISIALCMVSAPLFDIATHTFRPYSLFFLLTSISVFLFITQKRSGRIRDRVIYNISLILLLYSHSFGTLVCIGFFIVECLFYLRIKEKEQRKRRLLSIFLPYVIAAVFFSPWIITVFSQSLTRYSHFWLKSAPGVSAIFSIVTDIMGNQITCWIFWGSLIYLLIVLIQRNRERRLSVAESEKQIIRIAIVPVFMILVVWMASNNGISETSLFIPRYFICLLPFISICIGGTISLIYRWLCELSQDNLRVKALVFTLVCSILLFSGLNGYDVVNGRKLRDPEPYEAAADYLMIQPDIYNDDVGVFCVNYSSPIGWGYYLTHKDAREGITPFFRRLSEENISGLNKIYVFEVHKTLSSETLALLLESGFVEQERIEPERIIVFTRVEC